MTAGSCGDGVVVVERCERGGVAQGSINGVVDVVTMWYEYKLWSSNLQTKMKMK